MSSDLASEILAAMPPNFDMVPMKVASTFPLTVLLAGSTTPVPATAPASQPVAVGDTGYALWKPPVPPMVIVTTIDKWHVVGASGEPAFQNNWVNYLTIYGPARFTKRAGKVQLSGLVKSGTANSAIFTLPVGYRPSSALIALGIAGGNNAVRCDITTGGAVSFVSSDVTYVSMENISFFTD